MFLKKTLYSFSAFFALIFSGCDNIPLEKVNEHMTLAGDKARVFTWDYHAGTLVEFSFEHFSGGPMDLCVMGVSNYKRYRESGNYECVDKVSSLNTTSLFSSGWHKWDDYTGTLFMLVQPANRRQGSEGIFKFKIKI